MTTIKEGAITERLRAYEALQEEIADVSDMLSEAREEMGDISYCDMLLEQADKAFNDCTDGILTLAQDMHELLVECKLALATCGHEYSETWCDITKCETALTKLKEHGLTGDLKQAGIV